MPFLNDLRYALRSVRRSVFFASITVLTLGLGIGVITALFAVVDAVLLHPMAPDQDRVVRIWRHDIERNLEHVQLSYVEFKAWREQGRTFDSLAAIQYADASALPFTIDGEATAVNVAPVSGEFFRIMHGGDPLYGRWFEAAEEVKGAPLVAVISERFWRRATGGDPNFVGRRLTLAGTDVSILVVGIASAALDYPLGTDAWMPIPTFYEKLSSPAFDSEAPHFAQFHVVGRLTRDTSLEQAEAELTVLHRQWIAQPVNNPNSRAPLRIEMEPLVNATVGDVRQVLIFLSAAAALVFVIAGVNVAALLLMRASARARELAVRIVLGASQARLTRQTLTEALVLGVLGAISGAAIAVLLLTATQWLAPEEIPRIERAAIDLRVLGFCVAATLLWVLTFGAAPSWSRRTRETGERFGEALRSRGVLGTGALRVFAVAQIASAVVIAITSGLLVRSFVHLQGIDRGYDTSNMAVVSLLVSNAQYPNGARRVAFFEGLVARVASIPGVISVAPVHMIPGTANVGLGATLIFEGQSPDEARANPFATWEPVLPSFFQTLGVPIIRGRAFTDADSADGLPVTIVSEAMARRYWPGQDPIGKRLKFIASFPWATVVGVAADTRYRELTRSWMTVYFPAAQFFFFGPGSLVIRTAADPASLMPAIRQTIQNHERHVAINSISTMDALAGRELSRPRTALMIAGLFALMAVILAAVGVYGVVSYDVSQRGRELAVRSALGASPDRIFRFVVWRSVTIGTTGAAVGVVVAAVATRSLQVLLFEVSPLDPMTFAVGACTLIAIVLLAAYLPARRAAQADPLLVLRTE